MNYKQVIECKKTKYDDGRRKEPRLIKFRSFKYLKGRTRKVEESLDRLFKKEKS